VGKDSVQKGFASIILIIVVVVGAAIALLVVSGALKLEGKVSKSENKPSSVQPSEATKGEPTPETKTYQNDSLNLGLEYSAAWSIKENPAAGVVVAFGSPKESNDDQFVDNINLSTTDISSKPNMASAQLTDSWIKQSESAPSFSLLDRKPTTLAGESADQLIYTISNQDKSLKGMVIIGVKNKISYVITYTAEQSSFDKFLNAANALASSLKVK